MARTSTSPVASERDPIVAITVDAPIVASVSVVTLAVPLPPSPAKIPPEAETIWPVAAAPLRAVSEAAPARMTARAPSDARVIPCSAVPVPSSLPTVATATIAPTATKPIAPPSAWTSAESVESA